VTKARFKLLIYSLVLIIVCVLSDQSASGFVWGNLVTEDDPMTVDGRKAGSLYLDAISNIWSAFAKLQSSQDVKNDGSQNAMLAPAAKQLSDVQKILNELALRIQKTEFDMRLNTKTLNAVTGSAIADSVVLFKVELSDSNSTPLGKLVDTNDDRRVPDHVSSGFLALAKGAGVCSDLLISVSEIKRPLTANDVAALFHALNSLTQLGNSLSEMSPL
jgi:hypothetical protein